MTVEAREESASIIYSRNAISIGDTLNINFKFLGDDENIRVFLRREDNSRQDLILDRDYYIETSSGINNIWGVVRFSKSFSLITKVCIYRDVSVSQEKKFDSQTIFSSTAEKALDKLTMLMQDNQLKNNVIRAPEDEKINNDTLVLPPATDRVEKYLYFDKNGKVTTVESEGLVRSLRQGSREEEVDPTFELRKEDRIGKIISFDAKGSVDLKILSPVAVSGNYNDLINKPILSTVATSGKYSDLTEKLTAGANVQINGITVSATDTTYNNATQSVDGLMSKDDKRKVDNLSTVATTGSYNDLGNKPTNATTSADGFMSKEDKIKLNAAMKFPDGEAGYTLPNAAGRADKTITFDSEGNIDLHATWAYDNWRNVRVPTAESTFGLNLELPNSSDRANKVIGFNADGKSVEMKEDQVNSDWNATNGKAQILNKPMLAAVATSGSYRDLNNKLIAGENIKIDSDNVISAISGGGEDEFVNDIVVTGDMVSERIAFANRGTQDLRPDCLASFVIKGKKTFFIAKDNHIYRSNNCMSWYKTEEINNSYKIVSFLQSGENILFATRLDDYPNLDGEIFLSSDGGYSFTKTYVGFQSFYGWCESQGNILMCSYHGLYNSTDYGNTWNIVSGSVNGIFSSPVFFKGKFYFFRKTREYDEYRDIISMTMDYTFTTEYTFTGNNIPLSLTVDDYYIYAVVKDGTGYPQSFIYNSYTGSNFTLMQTYNNEYTHLLGRQNKWVLIDRNREAWFLEYFSYKPERVYSLMNAYATECHYSKDTDLFMIHDDGLLISTKAYHIGV